MSVTTTDVLVIGGGTMGTATGWALARGGHRVIVLEQFTHIHAFGSHGGKTRIFRHAYAEGEQYVPWTLEADRLWSELQERQTPPFMFRCGGLDISSPDGEWAHQARASAVHYGIEHEWLNGAEVNARFPAWNLPDDWSACFDPTAGFLDVEPALRALASEMIAAGGELRTGEQVISWGESPHGVTVKTDKGDYAADKLVITAGAWSEKVMAGLGLPLDVRRKPVFWFEPKDESLFKPERFPVFVADVGSDEFYGLPQYADPGIKSGVHSGGHSVNPDAINWEIQDDDLSPSYRAFLRDRFKGLSDRVVDSAVCMYTLTPDEHFLIDRYPGRERVAFASGFSGHGFKFTPVVGEYLATLVTVDRADVLPFFGYERLLGTPR